MAAAVCDPYLDDSSCISHLIRTNMDHFYQAASSFFLPSLVSSGEPTWEDQSLFDRNGNCHFDFAITAAPPHPLRPPSECIIIQSVE
jgi:hypothetical protein